MNKERIDQIALTLAEQIDDGSGEQYFVDQDGWIKDFAHALAESPEYLQAILPDGVGDCCYVNSESLNWVIFRKKTFARASTTIYAEPTELASTKLYPASAILAATAPLKEEIDAKEVENIGLSARLSAAQAEIERLNADRNDCLALAQSNFAKILDEQANVKVLTDALAYAKVVLTKLSEQSDCDVDKFCFGRSGGNIAIDKATEALATVRGK